MGRGDAALYGIVFLGVGSVLLWGFTIRVLLWAFVASLL